MKLGYARVSTLDQKLDLQLEALKREGCDRVFTDVASGAKMARPGLDHLLDVARDGDVIVAWKLDRIGRSLLDLVQLIGRLENRGVGLRVLTGEVDTTTASGKLVFAIFGALAEFERSLIVERTKAGLQAAASRGRRGGRPAALSRSHALHAVRCLQDQSLQDVADDLGVAKSTVHRHVERYVRSVLNEMSPPVHRIFKAIRDATVLRELDLHALLEGVDGGEVDGHLAELERAGVVIRAGQHVRVSRAFMLRRRV